MTGQAFTLTASELDETIRRLPADCFELLGMICEDWLVGDTSVWPEADMEEAARKLAKRIANTCAGVD